MDIIEFISETSLQRARFVVLDIQQGGWNMVRGMENPERWRRMLEMLFDTWFQAHKLDSLTVRVNPTTVLGPGNRDRHLNEMLWAVRDKLRMTFEQNYSRKIAKKFWQ